MPFTKLDPLKNLATLSNGDRTITASGAGQGAFGMLRDSQHDGTAYFEVTLTATGGSGSAVGAIQQPSPITGAAFGNQQMSYYIADGHLYVNSTDKGLLAVPAAGDVVAFVFRFATSTWFCKNLTQATSWNGTGADPSANTGGLPFPIVTGNQQLPGAWVPFGLLETNGASYDFNFGQSAFVGTVPSGITAGWAAVTDNPFAEFQNQFITGTAASSATVQFSTGGADRVVVIQITTGSVSGVGQTVSGITDTAGLTWAKRSSNQLNFGSGITNMEVWWAHAPVQLTNETITVNWTAPASSIVLLPVTFAGIQTPSAPWDSDGSLPASATHSGGASTPSVSGVSTASAQGVILEFTATANFTAPTSVDRANYAVMGPANANPSGGGGVASYEEFGYKAFSTAQSGLTISGGISTQPWSFIADALVGTGPGSVWASVEAADGFSAVGYPGAFGVLGDLEAFEITDAFHAAGFQPVVGPLTVSESRDIFSAFGRQPLTGVLTVTELRDAMVAHGLGRGEDGVFIVTENPDVLAALGFTPNSGTFIVTETADQARFVGSGVAHGVSGRRRIFFVT